MKSCDRCGAVERKGATIHSLRVTLDRKPPPPPPSSDDDPLAKIIVVPQHWACDLCGACVRHCEIAISMAINNCSGAQLNAIAKDMRKAGSKQ